MLIKVYITVFAVRPFFPPLFPLALASVWDSHTLKQWLVRVTKYKISSKGISILVQRFLFPWLDFVSNQWCTLKIYSTCPPCKLILLWWCTHGCTGKQCVEASMVNGLLIVYLDSTSLVKECWHKLLLTWVRYCSVAKQRECQLEPNCHFFF